MCTTCGCGNVDHSHAHEHHHHHDHDHHHHDHGLSHRMLHLEQDILGENAKYAQQNRDFFAAHNIVALNLVSSPGSGKTTLLESTLQHLDVPTAVIEGDQQTDLDAQRIRATGTQAYQINTGKVCHLDAHQIGHACEHLPLHQGGVLFIENIGNLVCPALFDLGEHKRIVILSVTEGDDKPLKYPEMFHGADIMVINKIDLLPYVNFNVEKCIEYAKRIRHDIQVFQVSATMGQGMEPWLGFLTTLTLTLSRQRERESKSAL